MVNIYTNENEQVVQDLNARLHQCIKDNDPDHVSDTYSKVRSNGPLFGLIITNRVSKELTADEKSELIQVEPNDEGWFPTEEE